MPKSLNTSKYLSLFVYGISALIISVHADTTAPVTNHTQTPNSPDGNNNWYVTPVEFDLNATDVESGVKEINYRIDGGPWQKTTFSGSLNLAPNPSFENPGSTSTSIESWEATIIDGNAVHSRDTGEYYTGFANSSAKIDAALGPWHGINNKTDFAVANPFDNMSASVWVKSQNITGNANFKIYSVSQDGSGNLTYIYLTQSNSITGTQDWTKLSANFVVNDANSIGVYMDLGLDTSGVLWADAVNIDESITSANVNFTVSTDSSSHTVEYYSVDNANNTETYSCPANNCSTFKLDQTPPGNWYNSGAIRSVGGAEHEVYVYTNVKDMMSGLSTNSDKYMYKVDTETEFGHFVELLHCNTPWIEDEWLELLTAPAVDGTKDSTLVTQRTDFCNSDWKVCKSVRFYAEDMAGNFSSKDFCINGPWIKFRGEGIVRANQNIDMIAESEEHNTDSLIELGSNILDFFTTIRNWVVRFAIKPLPRAYDAYLANAGSPTVISGDLVAASDIYLINGDYEIDNQSIPNNYSSSTFNQIVFVDGNLLISDNVEVDESSTALFIVSGNINIDKKVTTVGIGLFADGTISTAYNISEGEATGTVEFNGIYKANKFDFQRTLQGTNNQKYPSDSFTYEPKYLIQLRDLFGKHQVIWKNVN